ncbi:MAG: diguanylate cyclase [Proteobacteria bacterium SG_bin9]|nr:MAG: diguanylate cyclase [Proteobacteria bacterium SG_bin9]
MADLRSDPRGRTFLAGKIVSSYGQSSIDCVVRNMSASGACLEVENVIGVPVEFQLVMPGGAENKVCKVVWKSDDRVGVVFETAQLAVQKRPAAGSPSAQPERGTDLMRNQMLALRAALDEVEVGIVLLDAELRAQFINKAFRQMWKLPDAKADAKVPFVALMYHGRDTGAYEIPADRLDAYVAERVELVQRGDETPIDLRLNSGDVIRYQCNVLPNGGRMLSYTFVTDIVRHSDELEVLKAALDNLGDGVILLDAGLQAQFINKKARKLLNMSQDDVKKGASFAQIVATASRDAYDIPIEDMEAFVAARMAHVFAGDPTPRDIKTKDGRHLRAHCTKLPAGGRMVTYCDVTDLFHSAEQLQRLATTDVLTGVANRRQFLSAAEAEWSRFQRYHRPLSLITIDIDHFKSVNDRFGHATGDDAIRWIATACTEGQRASDIVGRLGGEEFAILLPETGAEEAVMVAERIRKTIAARMLTFHKVNFRITASFGVASATLSMSGVPVLMHASDTALYDAKKQGRDRVVLFSPPAEGLKLAAE